MDAKAKVAIGEFSRGGKSRVLTKAQDHDYAPDTHVTPFGFFLPGWKESYIFLTESKVTSDFIVDCLELLWTVLSPQFPKVKTLLLNLDNGGENSSSRTQFMNRLVAFSAKYKVTVKLAYYPPYHSKYNPSERLWGIIENGWRGLLLDSPEAVYKSLRKMTYGGKGMRVKWVEKEYSLGVSLTKKEMLELEKSYERHPELPKWFVTIPPPT